MPLLIMHRHNAGALSTEDTTRALGIYVAFAAGVLMATLFNFKGYLR